MTGRSEFIEKAERRAERRRKKLERIEQQQNAHVRQWLDKRAGDELVALQVHVALQRALTGATGIPEGIVELRPAPSPREVDNPSYTDGLYYADTAARRSQNAKVTVLENTVTRIGGLAHVKPGNPKDDVEQLNRRYAHHERVAAFFKAGYEGLFGSGVPALDNSRPVVDRSIVAHDSGMAAKIDRGDRVIKALAYLGPAKSDIIIDFLVFETPCDVYADEMPSGQRNQRQVAKLVQERLEILDSLSTFFGFAQRKARAA
jgi:hypothetical protein